MTDELQKNILNRLQLARRHLEYSYNKVLQYNLAEALHNDNQLEALEAFASRFSRFSDMVYTKAFRALTSQLQPDFQDAVFIDVINMADKLKWTHHPREWRSIRVARNAITHEYTIDDWVGFYDKLLRLTPVLLEVPLEKIFNEVSEKLKLKI